MLLTFLYFGRNRVRKDWHNKKWATLSCRAVNPFTGRGRKRIRLKVWYIEHDLGAAHHHYLHRDQAVAF